MNSRNSKAPSSNNAPASGSLKQDKQEGARDGGQKGSGLMNTLLVGLGVCCLLSVSANFLHADTFVHHAPDTAMARAMKEFKQNAFRSSHFTKAKQRKVTPVNELEREALESIDNEDPDEEEAMQNQVFDDPEGQHEDEHLENEEMVDVNVIRQGLPESKIGSLKCSKYGGPTSKESLEDMIYWHDIPSDQRYVSPLHAKRGERRQYLTFEPDGGGWNNIRMAMETIVGLAIAMGRTLVLPPAQGMYLLMKDKKKQNTDFSFADFFPMHEMAEENAGLEMMTMQEFLEREAMTGNLIDKQTGLPTFPPDNRTNWDGQDVKKLKEWLRNATFIEHWWNPGKCMAAFPASGNHKDIELLDEAIKEVRGEKSNSYIGHPADVDAPPKERLHENLNGRKELCVYNEEMQSQLVVHFMCYHKMRVRYLVHFYAFLFFEDWRQDLWMKRLMRDHMRYIDEIQCAAGRIVEALRKRASARGWNGHFDTFHIRRGDFQFKDTRIEATEILKNSKDVLTANKTIFIATDERDKKFFNPIKEAGYDVVFLDDFKDLINDINTNYYGMIDQLVASRGDIFLGCWHSTFTGFIMRMRGYHSTLRQLDGYLDGVLPTSYYYATPKNKLAMHTYQPLSGAFFNREFPTSWRRIDTSVGKMPVYNA